MTQLQFDFTFHVVRKNGAPTWFWTQWDLLARFISSKHVLTKVWLVGVEMCKKRRERFKRSPMGDDEDLELCSVGSCDLHAA